MSPGIYSVAEKLSWHRFPPGISAAENTGRCSQGASLPFSLLHSVTGHEDTGGRSAGQVSETGRLTPITQGAGRTGQAGVEGAGQFALGKRLQ